MAEIEVHERTGIGVSGPEDGRERSLTASVGPNLSDVRVPTRLIMATVSYRSARPKDVERFVRRARCKSDVDFGAASIDILDDRGADCWSITRKLLGPLKCRGSGSPRRGRRRG